MAQTKTGPGGIPGPRVCSGLEARYLQRTTFPLLTTAAGNANGAQALFVIDGAEPGDLSSFERACLIFDGRDENALNSARMRWKEAKESGIVASYWRESAAGKWEKQA